MLGRDEYEREHDEMDILKLLFCSVAFAFGGVLGERTCIVQIWQLWRLCQDMLTAHLSLETVITINECGGP